MKTLPIADSTWAFSYSNHLKLVPNITTLDILDRLTSIVRANVVHLNLSDMRTDASDLKRTKPSGTSAHGR